MENVYKRMRAEIFARIWFGVCIIVLVLSGIGFGFMVFYMFETRFAWSVVFIYVILPFVAMWFSIEHGRKCVADYKAAKRLTEASK